MNPDFNQSRDDPWNRAWLTSRELFYAHANAARHGGVPIHSVLGGTVFEFGRDGNNWLQVWASPTEVIAASPPSGARYGYHDESEVLHQFEELIRHLRGSDPLELGRVREGSSYGATCEPGAAPVLKWAQRGDWMFHYRDWPVLPEEWPTHCSVPQRMMTALPAPASVRKRLLLNVAMSRSATTALGAVGAVVCVAEDRSDDRATAEELDAACAAAEAEPGLWHGAQPGHGDTNPARVAFVALDTNSLALRAVRLVSEARYRAVEAQTGSEPIAIEAEYGTWAAEQAAQCDLVRDVLGNPFKPVALDPSWLTSDVVALARGIYADRAFDRMPILADALQDAGCANDDILNHCRDTAQVHARGCWVVDLLLGQS
jgi:hypothetical protein